MAFVCAPRVIQGFWKHHPLLKALSIEFNQSLHIAVSRLQDKLHSSVRLLPQISKTKEINPIYRSNNCPSCDLNQQIKHVSEWE